MKGAVILSTLLFSTIVACLSVTSPLSGSELDTSRKTTVTWSYNSSDPEYFGLYLINDNRLPSVSVEIVSNVSTTLGSYTFDGVDALPGSGYRFTFKDTTNSQLLVQSETFEIVSKGDDTTTVSADTGTATTTSISSNSATTTYVSTSQTTSTSRSTGTASSSTTSGSISTSSNASSGGSVPEPSVFTSLAGLVVFMFVCI